MEVVQEQQTIAKEIQTAVRHSVVYGLGNVLTKALGFFMLPFYTHYLNPADYGVLEILDLSMSLLGMFLNMGITAAVLRCYSAAKSDEERRRQRSDEVLNRDAGLSSLPLFSSVKNSPDTDSQAVSISWNTK